MQSKTSTNLGLGNHSPEVLLAECRHPLLHLLPQLGRQGMSQLLLERLPRNLLAGLLPRQTSISGGVPSV